LKYLLRFIAKGGWRWGLLKVDSRLRGNDSKQLSDPIDLRQDPLPSIKPGISLENAKDESY